MHFRSLATAASVLLGPLATVFAQERPPASEPPTQEVPRASFLSRSPLLFEPLLADPRWPHFSAAWQSYHASEFESVGAVSFGESFTFYRAPVFDRAAWEIGFQAAVFAIFDLDQESLDLVNADYLAGPVLAFRDGPVSVLLRLIHESSHLGDEYLLSTGIERINLSYETVDLLLSWQVHDDLRLYGGGGNIVHSDTELDRWLARAGAEYLAPASFGTARPVAAIEVQGREYNDWNADLSIRVGLQFQDQDAPHGRVQLMAEYYRGCSPNGQFFVDEIEFVGIGLHFYF